MRKLTTNQVSLLQTLDRAPGRAVESFPHEARQSLCRLANRGLIYLERGGFYDLTGEGIKALQAVMFAEV